MYLSVVRVIFLPLRLIFLLFLVFPLLLFIQTPAFQAEFAALDVNQNILHLIKLRIVARGLCALLCKLRSPKLAKSPLCRRVLQEHKAKFTKATAKMHCAINFQAFFSCQFEAMEFRCVSADLRQFQSGGRGGGDGGNHGVRTLKICCI